MSTTSERRLYVGGPSAEPVLVLLGPIPRRHLLHVAGVVILGLPRVFGAAGLVGAPPHLAHQLGDVGHLGVFVLLGHRGPLCRW